MKKTFKFKNLIFSLLICFALLLLACPFYASKKANAQPRQFSAAESIFLRSPTYSTVYDDGETKKVYTIDSYDNFLKAYSYKDNAFEDEYLDLSNYTIIDAIFLKTNLFVLASNQSSNVILKIDIETKEIETLTSANINELHTKIFVQEANIDSVETFLITLTNAQNEQDVTPLVICAKADDFSVNFECIITFDTAQSNILSVKNNLFKTFTIMPSNDEIQLVFIHGNVVSFTEVSITTLKTETAQITSITQLYDSLESTVENIEISSANLITISSQTHFAITYQETSNEVVSQNTQIYNFNIADGTNTKFEKKTYVTHEGNSAYALTNAEYLIYPIGQAVHYDKFSISQDSYSCDSDSVSNPSLDIAYFEDSNFVYKQTNKTTKLLANPWDSAEIIEIPQEVDLIQIGTSSIKSSGYQLADYIVCLYTANDTNYTGYIKLEDVDNKNTIDIEDYKYNPVFTVHAGTKLYSLPTKVLGGGKITTGYSTVIKTISAHQKVYIVDTICEYIANNSMMLKVKVGEEVGYIDCNSIIAPSKDIDFLITNANIKKDGTYVYTSADSNSVVKDVLKKDQAVQIQGKRNTKNGYTYIKYNDEYGNVLDGYIKTDYVETTSWTTLQILGCVLIAVNIGLLVLILLFRKRKIGRDGIKYKKEEKPNYHENQANQMKNEE